MQLIRIETPMGSIDVALDDAAAPRTVANFLSYMDAGVYDGGCFYRTVTPDNQPNDTVRIAVIQGGKSGDYAFDDTANLPLERTSQTGLTHLDGTISMARFTPDSANSEFFICVGDQPELDFGGKRNPDGQGFAAFGSVTNGMDVVHAINQSPCIEQTLEPLIPITRVSRISSS